MLQLKDEAEQFQVEAQKASRSQGTTRKKPKTTKNDSSKNLIKYPMNSDQQMEADLSIALYIYSANLEELASKEPFHQLVGYFYSSL